MTLACSAERGAAWRGVALRSQCAHVMAMAVQRLFKDAQVTIGPWIDRGFYYDFDIKQPLTEKDLKSIKKEMAKIAKANLPFVREEVRGCPAGPCRTLSGACTHSALHTQPGSTGGGHPTAQGGAG